MAESENIMNQLNWELGKIFMEENEEITEWSDKKEVMARICDYFDYMWRFHPNGEFVMEDRLLTEYRTSDCDLVGRSSCGHLEYNNLDEMLLDWIDMLRVNQDILHLNDWSKEISIIEKIKVEQCEEVV